MLTYNTTATIPGTQTAQCFITVHTQHLKMFPLSKYISETVTVTNKPQEGNSGVNFNVGDMMTVSIFQVKF
jgi:hypothetical protein